MTAQTTKKSSHLYTSSVIEEHIYEAPREPEAYEVTKEVEAVLKQPNNFEHYYQVAATTD